MHPGSPRSRYLAHYAHGVEDVTPSTWVVAGGRTFDPGDPLNVPITLASNFRAGTDRGYSRGEGTATWEALEELVGGLEGGRAVAFSSGMAAAAAVLNLLSTGSHIAFPDDCYHGVASLIDEGVEKGRWSSSRFDGADTASCIEAVLSADLVWLDSVSNPLLTVADIPAIALAERKPGGLLVVDNTFATPLNQRPLAFGADIVMHSATKFLGGHSDVLSGVLVAQDPDVVAALADQRHHGGATPGALEAYLVTRGIRTLAVRMRQAQANAIDLADRLQDHSEILRVRYPGLVSHGTYGVAQRVLDGPGAMMSFEIAGPADRATAFCDALRIIVHATSLGAVESSMERRAGTPGQEHLPPTLVRFSVGIEDVDELWGDIVQALEASGSHR
ncbi:Cystathionine gamma-synthase [hydrothermal vent metagenome]|uniref:Cystathionine gamma-synthase n=1 Tax=hydrothermal vent metagenome TaxID=652676 RepID=A0A3B0SVD1_9ZZZZ